MPNPQARDEDKNMEDRQNTSSGGHQGERHRRSPSHERLSRSPNQSPRSQRRDRPSADHEAIPWTHEPMSGAILHDVDDCSTGGGYFSHFHKAYRHKSPTMLDALNERAALTVPVDEHEKLFAKFEDCTEDGRDMLDEIKRLKAESDDQQRQIQELTTRQEEMLHDQVNPSASFKRKKTVTEQVIEPVQRTMCPLPVRPVQPSTARQVVAPPPNETPV